MAPAGNEATTGRYVPVNGLTMYYEDHGAGPPLVLVHGGLGTSQNWAPHLPAFAQHFRVITPDSRGHGRTDNPTGELSYRLLAADLAAFIQALGLHQPFICGYSDGGQIALELGMGYPDLAGALVLGATWYQFSDSYRHTMHAIGFEEPGVVNVEQMERAMPEFIAQVRAWHAPRPGPTYWQTLARQLSVAWLTPLGYTAADFQRVVAPTLVLIGDRDPMVPVEEAVAMYGLLAQAELAIIPGADHIAAFTKVAPFTAVVLDFLLRHQAGPGQA